MAAHAFGSSTRSEQAPVRQGSSVAARTLVVATPQFTAHWLDQGIIPDAGFMAAHPDEFAPQVAPGHGKDKY